MDMIDKFAQVIGREKEVAFDFLDSDNIGSEEFSEAYLELLKVADKKCVNCPGLPIIAGQIALGHYDLDEEKATVRLANENKSCVYGAQIIVGGDGPRYQCTSESWIRGNGFDPWGGHGTFTEI